MNYVDISTRYWTTMQFLGISAGNEKMFDAQSLILFEIGMHLDVQSLVFLGHRKYLTLLLYGPKPHSINFELLLLPLNTETLLLKHTHPYLSQRSQPLFTLMTLKLRWRLYSMMILYSSVPSSIMCLSVSSVSRLDSTALRQAGSLSWQMTRLLR